MSSPVLRVARPSDNLEPLIRFYCDGLGMALLERFEDHAGFDGIMVGRRDAPYHFEFTRKRGHVVGRAPSADNLLVFYFAHAAEWQAAVERMTRAGHSRVASFNPYWDVDGVTFEDPDGYRIVLQNGRYGSDGNNVA
jgi:catechol 2,3-dioxygenase-like lactoylglutathione lyase family enzyme